MIPPDVKERERYLLGEARAGRAVPLWAPLFVELPDGRTLVLSVSSDALQVEGVRLPVTAATQDQLAAIYGALPLTARLADLIYAAAATKLPPYPSGSAAWAKTPYFRQITTRLDQAITHSRILDEALKARGHVDGTIAADVGKDWILRNGTKAGRVVNYGWHSSQAKERSVTPSVAPNVYQSPGSAHDSAHVDYSQTARFVHRAAMIDGAPVDVANVLRDPQLAKAISDQGPLTSLSLLGGSPPSPPSEDGEPPGDVPVTTPPAPPIAAPPRKIASAGVPWGGIGLGVVALGVIASARRR